MHLAVAVPHCFDRNQFQTSQALQQPRVFTEVVRPVLLLRNSLLCCQILLQLPSALCPVQQGWPAICKSCPCQLLARGHRCGARGCASTDCTMLLFLLWAMIDVGGACAAAKARRNEDALKQPENFTLHPTFMHLECRGLFPTCTAARQITNRPVHCTYTRLLMQLLSTS